MRTLVALALVAALGGCKSKPRAEEPNRDPYRNVTPARAKQQVEETQKKEDERNDRVLEQAK